MKTCGPVLPIEPLTAEAFAAFGEVIEAGSAKSVYAINEGTAMRHHDLAHVDTASEGGRTLISLFRAQPRSLPFELRRVERHPLGSQAFVPLDPQQAYIVVVCSDPSQPPRAFLARDGQGVNYRAGTWHHPLIALDQVSNFLVIDRGGPGKNCDEVDLLQTWVIETARPA